LSLEVTRNNIRNMPIRMCVQLPSKGQKFDYDFLVGLNGMRDLGLVVVDTEEKCVIDSLGDPDWPISKEISSAIASVKKLEAAESAPVVQTGSTLEGQRRVHVRRQVVLPTGQSTIVHGENMKRENDADLFPSPNQVLQLADFEKGSENSASSTTCCGKTHLFVRNTAANELALEMSTANGCVESPVEIFPIRSLQVKKLLARTAESGGVRNLIGQVNARNCDQSKKVTMANKNQRRPRACFACHESGHLWRKCPMQKTRKSNDLLVNDSKKSHVTDSVAGSERHVPREFAIANALAQGPGDVAAVRVAWPSRGQRRAFARRLYFKVPFSMAKEIEETDAMRMHLVQAHQQLEERKCHRNGHAKFSLLCKTAKQLPINQLNSTKKEFSNGQMLPSITALVGPCQGLSKCGLPGKQWEWRRSVVRDRSSEGRDSIRYCFDDRVRQNTFRRR
jgi:hypothetical protein